MAIVRDTHSDFERMALRVAGDDILQYNELMRGTVKDYTSACVAYIERLVAIRKQTRKNG